MDLSICIVSYNVRNDLKECLFSIEEHLRDIEHEIIVVDNASKDATGDMMRADFPEVHFIENNENLGFAKANNIAYRHSKGAVLLFLNPDTKLTPKGFGVPFQRFLPDKTAGAMGPRLLNSDGSIQKGAIRKFPGLLNTIIRLTFLRKLPGLKGFSRRYRMHDFNFEKPSSVDQISGAAFFVKKDIFETTGLFDEKFFMFYEEVDLCKRIRESGFDVIYEPEIEIIHKGGQSRKGESSYIKAINIKSLLYYFRKHQRGIRKYSFLLSFKMLYLFDLFVEFAGDAVIILLPFISDIKKAKRREKREFRAYFIKKHLFSFLFCW